MRIDRYFGSFPKLTANSALSLNLQLILLFLWIYSHFGQFFAAFLCSQIYPIYYFFQCYLLFYAETGYESFATSWQSIVSEFGQFNSIQQHHSNVHHRHHPTWIGISYANTLGVLRTPSVLEGNQLHQGEPYFHRIGPLGWFGLVFAMSVRVLCVVYCLSPSHAIFFVCTGAELLLSVDWCWASLASIAELSCLFSVLLLAVPDTVLCKARGRGFFRCADSFVYISRQGMTSIDLCLKLIPPGQGNQPRRRQPALAGLASPRNHQREAGGHWR